MTKRNTLPDFAKPKIETLKQRAEPIVGRLLVAIKTAKESDFSIYEKTHAIKLQSDILAKPRRELHALISEFLTDFKARKHRVNSKVLGFTEPKINPDPSTQLTGVLREQEIRSLLRNVDLEQRKAMVESELKSGNSEILTAISSAPDSLIPRKTLNEFRERFAYSQDPELQNYKSQVDELAKIVRKECGQLNSDHTKILMDNKFDDPLALSEHFMTFPPLDERQKKLSETMVSRQNNIIELQHKHNASKDVGVNL